MKKITLFCSLLFLFSALAAQTSWISFSVNNTFTLDARADKTTLKIPLTVESADDRKALALKMDHPVYLSFNNRYDSSMAAGVSLKLMPGDIPALIMAINLNQLPQGGNYTGQVGFAAGTKETRLSFTLERPAAKLETVGMVKIRMEGDDITESSLVLKETGGVSLLKIPKIGKPVFDSLNKWNPVSFPDSVYTVPAGGQSKLSYSVDPDIVKEMNLGPNAGSLIIKPEQLPAPVSISFEITRTHAKWWIPVIVFLGLTFGVVVRQLLPKGKAKELSKVKAYEFIAKIAAAMEGIADETFRSGCAVIINNLKTKADDLSGIPGTTNTTESLDADMAASLTKYDELKKDLDSRLSEVKKKIDNLTPYFNQDDLTPSIILSLSDAKGLYDKAVAEFKKGNPPVAGTHIGDAEIGLKAFLDKYPKLVKALVENFNETVYPAKIPDELKDKNKPVLATLAEKIKAFDPAATNIDRAKFLLTDEVERNLDTVLAVALKDTTAVFNTVHKDNNSQPMIAFKVAFEIWKAMLEKRIADAVAAIDKTITGQLSTAWTGTPVESVFGDQAETAVSQVKHKDENKGSLDDIAAGKISVSTPLAKARNNWWLYASIQTLLLTMIIGVIAYKTYAPAFVGTFTEVITIFMTAFAIDITVDKVVAMKSTLG